MYNKYAVAVDIGGTKTRIAIGNDHRKLLELTILPTSDIDENSLVNVVDDMIRESGIPHESFSGIGLSVPGILDTKNKRVVKAANIPLMTFKILEDELSLSVKMENDANAGAIGEWFAGSAAGVNNFAYLTMSTGIGCGVFYDGKVFGSAKSGRHGEVGFFVVEPDGELDVLGKRGVWQAYCSGKGIPMYIKHLLRDESRPTKLRDIPELNAKDLFDLSRSGDRAASDYVKRIARYNAIGMGALITAYNPDLIVIGGSVALSNPELIDMTKNIIPDYTINSIPDIRISKLGDKVCVYGSLALGLGVGDLDL